MAIWHFKFSMVPFDGVVRLHGEPPDVLESYQALGPPEYIEDAEFPNYWDGVNVLGFAPEILEIAPSMPSWSDDALMFGIKDEHQIELWDNDVHCKIDVRSISLKLLQDLVEFGARHDCLFAIHPTGELIEPVLPLLADRIKDSVAYRFCLDPGATLEGIARQPPG